MDMIKEERDRLFAQNGWSKNDVRLLLKYIEELEASRDSRQLSAVPSEREIGLVKKILAARKCLELSEFQKAWNELYLTPDERGIAG